MNHIYRVVFNHQTGTFQAVSEIAKTPHKTGKTKSTKIFKALLTPISLALSLAFGLSAHASPKDGQITAGVATIHQNGLITDINQTSQNAAINWQSFNIAHNETVNFNQPNAGAVTLNRVIGNEKSVIDGAMNANGKVFISNANGMLIGKDAQINVGSLVATTANISDDDVMNGRYQFTGGQGSIENLGQISVPKGGVVALVAPIVKNGGKITAHEGNVLLASAENFSITLPDNANFKYTLDKGTLQGLVDNGGAILADGGRVVLTAQGVDTVKKSLIKHTGAIQANTVQNKNGVIELLGDLDNSALTVRGSLKAEAKESGDGGFIETSASQVKIEDSAEVSTLAENGKTGTWLIDPNDIIIASSAGIKPDGTPYTKDEISMSGNKISNVSNKSNVHILSTHGKSQGKGDVIIDDEIFWVNSGMNPTHTLKLTAHNDIHINKTIDAKGAVKLVLEYGQGTANGGESNYYLDKKTPLKDRTTKINLPEGKTFSTKKGSDGKVVEFDVIHKMPEITKNKRLEWESKFTSPNIALGTDIDVSHTTNYSGFSGWKLSTFSPKVSGLGHTVDGLTLNNTKDNQSTGLFQDNNTALADNYIRDIGVTNANIKSMDDYSPVGGLVGVGSNIYDSYVTGKIHASKSDAGGLAGRGNNIFNSFAEADVSSSNYYADVGGLVGSGRNISNSYFIGNVSSQQTGSNIGGLVGSGKDVFNSYAQANISSKGFMSNVGGLVGKGENINNSYAKGIISSTGNESNIGGLVGLGRQIKNSYADNKQIITQGYKPKVGGIIGEYLNNTDSNIKNDSSNSFFNKDSNPNVFAIGNISDTSLTDNLSDKTAIELTKKDTFVNWDFDNIWYINDGETPKLHAHKKGTVVINPVTPPTNPNPPTTPNPPTVSPVNKTDLAVQANNLNKVYDGKTVATESDLRAIAIKNGHSDIVTVNGLKNGDTLDKLGTLTYNGSWKNAKNAGKYSIVPTGLTGGQDYEIKYGEGSLTIDKRPVKFMLSGEKVYDGTVTANIDTQAHKNNQSGVIEADFGKISVKGTGILTDKNAGIQTIKSVSGATLVGALADNYLLEKVDGEWKINKKPIAVTVSRIYDGTNNALPTLQGDNYGLHNSIYSNLVQADKDKISTANKLLNTFALTGNGTISQKDVGKDIKVADKGSLQLTGARQQEKDIIANYELDVENSKWEITKRPLAIQAMNNIKPEGENNPDVSRIGVLVTGLVGGEKINHVDLSYSDDKKWQGETSAIIVGKPNFEIGSESNYEIKKQDGILLTVQKDYEIDDKVKDITNVAQIDNSLSKIADEMLLATAVYKDNGKFREIYSVIDKKTGKVVDKILYAEGETPKDTKEFKYEKLYQLIDKADRTYKEFAHGLGVGLYEKNMGNNRYKYYLVFRGTDAGVAINPFAADGGANVAQKIGLFTPEQYIEAAAIAKNLIKENKNIDLTVVGHSLGGGLATYAAGTLGKDIPAITFNTAPLGLKSMIDIGKVYGKSTVPPISHFVFDNDILNSDNLIGTRYKVDLLPNKQDSGWFDSKISDAYDNGVADHSMAHVIKTQKLAHILAQNNQMMSDCHNNAACFMIKENFYTLSGNSKQTDPFILSLEKEKPVKVIQHGDKYQFGNRRELFKIFNTPIVYFTGFRINYPYERVYADGSSKVSMPIYNSMNTTLEIQVLDKNGKVIDTKFADPKILTSNMIDAYGEMIDNALSDEKGFENGSASKRTDIDIKVPQGGSIRLSYNTTSAKMYNFIDPIADMLGNVFNFEGNSMATKEMARLIVVQMIKNGQAELLKDLMRQGIGLGTPQAKENTGKMLEMFGSSLKQALEQSLSAGNAIGTSIDMMGVANKLIGGSNAILEMKEWAETAVTMMNFYTAGENLITDYSSYDVLLSNDGK